MIKLNVKRLQEAIKELNDVQGIPYDDITAISGVHNLGRIKAGQSEPTANTWWKLHKAYPIEVPAPEYIEETNGNTVTNFEGASIIGGKKHSVNQGNGFELTKAQERFFKVASGLFPEESDWEKLLEIVVDLYRKGE